MSQSEHVHLPPSWAATTAAVVAAVVGGGELLATAGWLFDTGRLVVVEQAIEPEGPWVPLGLVVPTSVVLLVGAWLLGRRASATGAAVLVAVGLPDAVALVGRIVLDPLVVGSVPVGLSQGPLVAVLAFGRDVAVVVAAALAVVAARPYLVRVRPRGEDRLLWLAAAVAAVALHGPSFRDAALPAGVPRPAALRLAGWWEDLAAQLWFHAPVMVGVLAVVWLAAGWSRRIGGTALVTLTALLLLERSLAVVGTAVVGDAVPTPALWAQVGALGGLLGIGIGWLRHPLTPPDDRGGSDTEPATGQPTPEGEE